MYGTRRGVARGIGGVLAGERREATCRDARVILRLRAPIRMRIDTHCDFLILKR